MSMDTHVILQGDSPLVVSFPHSGLKLSEGLDECLTPQALGLPDTDWHVPQLYDFLDEMGASRIYAKYSRYVVDLNRDPSGVSLYPGQATTGLIPTDMFDGAAIYLNDQMPDKTEIEQRRVDFHAPYHQALSEMLNETKARHGYAVLWDAHSIISHVPRLFDGALPDLNLGTNSGQSCADSIEAVATKTLQAHTAFKTITNGRFKGGWITRHYGQPDQHIHALQMEIAQSAYMDESPPWAFDHTKAGPLRLALQDIMQAALDAARRLYKDQTS